MKRTKSRQAPVSGSLGSGGGFELMPLEWFNTKAWQLPSGKALIEFAMKSGSLAPLLLSAGALSRNDRMLSRQVGEQQRKPRRLA
jgi:hypothetical protein